MQRPDGGFGLFPQGIHNADHCRQPSRNAQIEMGVFLRQRVEFRLFALRDYAAFVLKDKVGAADDNLFVLHGAGNAVSHHILHLRVVFLVIQPQPPGFRHHSVGHGVGIVLLQTGGQTQHFTGTVPVKGHNLGYGRGGAGQRAGFVKHHGIGLSHSLHKPAALDGNMIPAALPHGGEHGNGHGQLQCAGEVHHENRQRLHGVPGQEIRQYRAAQGIGHQPIRQPGGLVLRRGFQLFGLLNHLHNAVIPAAAGGLIHPDDAFALFHHRACIDTAAGAFGHRERLTGDGCLIHRGFAFRHLSVQRNHAAGADYNAVPGLHIPDGHQYLGVIDLHPDLVHIQGHGAGQIRHGLLMSPVIQNFANPQHEHNGTGGIEIPPHHGYGDGGGVQHGYGQAAVEQSLQPRPDVSDGAESGNDGPEGSRQEQLAACPAQDGEHQPVLKFPVQFPGTVIRRQFLRLFVGEYRQRMKHRFPAAGVADDGVAGAVINPGGLGTGLLFQVSLQNVRLTQGHSAACHMDTKTPGAFVQNCTFHCFCLQQKERRKSRQIMAAFH